MKISVIIPVYNTEERLKRCLDSVVAQTFKDFECIVVDDGSKDLSPQIIDEFAANSSITCGDWSVLPSSTTMHSKSSNVCATTLSRHRLKRSPVL